MRKKLIHEESRAIYVHCRAHKLNLFVQDAFKSSNGEINVIGVIPSLIGFIRGSPKRLSWFYQFLAVEGNYQLLSLRSFCPNRWIMRLISLEAIRRDYTPIIMWLQEVDEQVRTDSEAKAGGFFLIMRKFNTHFCIEVLRMTFSVVESASAQL